MLLAPDVQSLAKRDLQNGWWTIGFPSGLIKHPQLMNNSSCTAWAAILEETEAEGVWCLPTLHALLVASFWSTQEVVDGWRTWMVLRRLSRMDWEWWYWASHRTPPFGSCREATCRSTSYCGDLHVRPWLAGPRWTSTGPDICDPTDQRSPYGCWTQSYTVGTWISTQCARTAICRRFAWWKNPWKLGHASSQVISLI